ncbi:MAG: hypothetical protein RL088_3416 [Verrucomicrobiota bacterium]|jgi:hypothetical protein
MAGNQFKADEVAEQFQKPGSTFPISGKIHPKAGGEFNGFGTISRIGDKFVLHLTFAAGGEPPEEEAGRTYDIEDFWGFEGVIGLNLPVVVEHLSPFGTRYWSNGITSQDYATQSVKFQSVGFNSRPMREILALLSHLESNTDDGRIRENSVFETPSPTNVEPSPEEQNPSRYANGTWIHALVLDYPLIHRNGGTNFTEKNDFLGETTRSTLDTFSGKFDGVEFGLVQRGGNLDIYLFLRTATEETESLDHPEQLLKAFTTGLAFATGQHCWPYRVTICRNGAELLDRITATSKVDRTSLAPFSERIGFNAKLGRIEWEFSDFLCKATQFFTDKTPLSEAAAQALWLLRAADSKGIPGPITLSSLCVLLESLACLIFDELHLESVDKMDSFEQAKGEAKAWLENHCRKSEPGFVRLRNAVGALSLLRPADKYRAVSDHYGLKWEGLMEDAWKTWGKVRHKLVHATLSPEAINPDSDAFVTTGRIAGAINVLVLRLIGYSGIARTSVFEDKHHNI